MTLNVPYQLTTRDFSILGLIDGTNRIFTLTGATALGMDLFWNGVFLTQGNDYVFSDNTITMITPTAPNGTDFLSAMVWSN